MKNTKKIMKKAVMMLLMATMLLGLCMATGNPAKANAATLKLDMQSANLLPNETLTLQIASAGKKKIVWKSSDKKVATVSSNGKVTARDNIGKSCTITATVGTAAYKCKISVIESKPYGTFYVYNTNYVKSGLATDGQTYLDKVEVYYMDIVEKKDGYYFSARAYDYKVTDLPLLDNNGGKGYYIGKKLQKCFTNPMKYRDENAVNIFLNAKDKYVFESWRNYTDEEWAQRTKELGYEN